MSTYAFCIVRPDEAFPDRAYGPQGKIYTVVGRLDDGRAIGVAEVYPSELAIIASPAHRGEYVGASWAEVLASPFAAAVDWAVEVEEPTPDGAAPEEPTPARRRWMPEREVTTETVVRTARGNPKRRPPLPLADALAFDPDVAAPATPVRVPVLEGSRPDATHAMVGTYRVEQVEGSDDAVLICLTDGDGDPAWFRVQAQRV
ncbi:MAG TPA: hypothetical protein VFQ39_03370 [Longimicrobium sp.]|nr:hypothetical protein [Longimicrobium sp.]